ncbi:MAG: amino acid permease [Myxococcales bacterium]|nr:amino acid permease [Myxococcales bacterium]
MPEGAGSSPDDAPRPADPSSLPRVLGLGDATMLVVSSVIGVGIFFTPGGVARSLPRADLFFAAWTLGGVLALAGALANAELGAMFPRAGGNYVYLRAAYHPSLGFLVGWLSFFAIFTGTVATLAVGFADGLATFFPMPPAARSVVAIGIVWLTSLVSISSTRAGARLNSATGALKVLAMVGLVVAGLVLGSRAPAPAEASAPPDVGLGAFGLAMSPVIFSYLGWNASVYVAGEIKDPDKNLPRSLFIGLGVCTLVYVLVTWTYVRALGIDGLAAVKGNVGEATARAIIGPGGRTVMAVMVLASVFGCLNANVLVGPRIAYAMARDGLFWRGAARLRAGSQTPHYAIIVQAAAASIVILRLKTFRSVLDYTTFAIVLATIADTLALYVLRLRKPDQRRPYRAAGYPIVPGLYLLTNLGIATSLAIGKPLECVMGLLVLAAGVPVYLVFSRRRATG